MAADMREGFKFFGTLSFPHIWRRKYNCRYLERFNCSEQTSRVNCIFRLTKTGTVTSMKADAYKRKCNMNCMLHCIHISDLSWVDQCRRKCLLSQKQDNTQIISHNLADTHVPEAFFFKSILIFKLLCLCQVQLNIGLSIVDPPPPPHKKEKRKKRESMFALNGPLQVNFLLNFLLVRVMWHATSSWIGVAQNSDLGSK